MRTVSFQCPACDRRHQHEAVSRFWPTRCSGRDVFFADDWSPRLTPPPTSSTRSDRAGLARAVAVLLVLAFAVGVLVGWLLG